MTRLRTLPTLHWLAARVFSRGGAFRTTGRSGLTFHAIASDDIARHIAKYGGHEPELTQWIDAFLKAQIATGIVVDVGANIGWHALHAAKHKNVSKVIACEADAQNAALLARNINENHLENIYLAPWAIADAQKVVMLNSYKTSNLGRHSVVQSFGFGALAVPAFTLDDTLTIFGVGEDPVQVLKIDVEGYEYAVIAGAQNVLARTKAIVIEFSPEIMQRAGIDKEKLIGPLFAAYFQPHILQAGILTPITRAAIEKISEQTDLIWLRA